MKKSISKHYLFDEISDNLVRNKSKELNISESEYIRKIVLTDSKVGDYILLKKDLQRLLRELSYIGNNINQIAHIANMMMLSKNDLEVIENYRKELYCFRILIQKMLNDLKDGVNCGNNKNGVHKG